MFGIGLATGVLLLALPVVVALVLAAVLTGAFRGPHVAESRRVVAARLSGLLVGCGAATWLVLGVTELGELGRGLMLAPVAVGVGLLLGVIAGETLVRPARPGAVRTASLAPRRITDHVPTALSVVVGLLVLTSAVLLTFTTLTGEADELDRPGRQFALACSAWQDGRLVEATSARGPYPGAFYSVPLAVGLLVALVLAGLAARQVVRRPRGVSSEAGDDALRRRSATAVVAALGITFAAPLVGVAGAAGSAISGVDCLGATMPVLGAAALVVALLSVLALAWCVLALLVPEVALRRTYQDGSAPAEERRVRS